MQGRHGLAEKVMPLALQLTLNLMIVGKTEGCMMTAHGGEDRP